MYTCSAKTTAVKMSKTQNNPTVTMKEKHGTDLVSSKTTGTHFNVHLLYHYYYNIVLYLFKLLSLKECVKSSWIH